MQTIDTKTDTKPDTALNDPVDKAMSSAETAIKSLSNSLDDLDREPVTPSAATTTQTAQTSSKYSSEPNTESGKSASSSGKKQTSKRQDKRLNRWPRAFARVLDLAWEMILVVGLIAFFASSDLVNSGFGSPLFYLVLFISLPIALMLDAIVASLFGNTPFKAIVGVKAVSARGERLGLQRHIRRNIGVWTDGLGMGILPMSLFTLTRQFKRVSGRREAIYDERLHARSHSSQYAGLRLMSLVLVTLGAAVGLLTYAYLTQNTSTEKKASAQDFVSEQLTPIAQTESIVEDSTTSKPGSTDSSESSTAAAEAESTDSSERATINPETNNNETQSASTSNGALRQWINPVSNLQSEIPQRFASIPTTDALAVFRDLSTGAEVTLEEFNNATSSFNEQTASRLIREKFSHIDFDNQAFTFPLGEWSIHEMQGQDGSTQARASAQIAQTASNPNQTYLIFSTTNSLNLDTIDDIDRLKAAIWSTLPTP